MALQTSGSISLNDMHIEVGGTSGTTVSLNDSDIRALLGKASGAQSSFNEFYGASSEYELTSSGTINGQAHRQEITVSSFISSGGTFIIPSNLWVWSDNRTVAALTVDIPCTIINYGKVIGKGGNGGWAGGGGQSGGPAIKINSGISGVTITNHSGAYIAGGGGGGGGGSRSGKYAGGGGGAGGGAGGGSGGAGGALNATGGHVGGVAAQRHAWGGGAGGGGGFGHSSYPGGGGGRILPGIGGYYSFFHSTNYSYNWSNNSNGHTTSTGNSASGGAGGSGGSSGNNAGHAGTVYNGGGGGGGWGASGGTGRYGGGGSGGKAIDDSGNSYSLSNSGTIYGGT